MRCYIALGSNLDEPLEQILTASRALAEIPHSTLVALSSCYHSAPLDGMDQPWYVNRVAALDTRLSPEVLLDALQQIERQQGRIRTVRWAPRTLDLDLLLYGELVMQSPRLQIPHPGMTTRNFVLHPLAELVGDLILPTGQRLSTLCAHCSDAGLIRIDLATDAPTIDGPARPGQTEGATA